MFHQKLHALVVVIVLLCSLLGCPCPLGWRLKLLCLCVQSVQSRLILCRPRECPTHIIDCDASLMTAATSADNFSVKMLSDCENRWSWYWLNFVNRGSTLSDELWVPHVFLSASNSFKMTTIQQQANITRVIMRGISVHKPTVQRAVVNKDSQVIHVRKSCQMAVRRPQIGWYRLELHICHCVSQLTLIDRQIAVGWSWQTLSTEWRDRDSWRMHAMNLQLHQHRHRV